VHLLDSQIIFITRFQQGVDVFYSVVAKTLVRHQEVVQTFGSNTKCLKYESFITELLGRGIKERLVLCHLHNQPRVRLPFGVNPKVINTVPTARFQVLTATSMEITVFWDVAQRSLVEVYRRFTGAYCLQHQGPDHLWNVGKFLQDNTAQHPRRQYLFFQSL
jgi:hypothetical protein